MITLECDPRPLAACVCNVCVRVCVCVCVCARAGVCAWCGGAPQCHQGRVASLATREPPNTTEPTALL